MNMSSERVLFTPTVTAFTYQNFSGGEISPEIPTETIFENLGAERIGHRIEPAIMADSELKRQGAAAYAEGFAAGRREALAGAQRKNPVAREPLAAKPAGVGRERGPVCTVVE